MAAPDTLEAYHFYEDSYEDYAALREAFSWEVPETFNIASYICDRWSEDKGKVAFFDEDAAGTERTLTYWQVQTMADRLANYLASQGVGRGDRVGVCLGQRPEVMISHIAVWKLGAVTVPLSMLFGPDALSYRLDDCDATACIVTGESVETLRSVREDLPSLETVVVLDTEPEGDETTFAGAREGQPRTFETVETDPDDDAAIIYTSGTTGNPKGALHAHRFALGCLPQIAQMTFMGTGQTEGHVFWIPVEWSWIGSMGMILSAMYYGVPAVSYSGQFDPEKSFGLVEKYGITFFGGPPTMLRMMQEVEDPTERYHLETLQVIGAGGEAIDQGTIDWANETFGEVAIQESFGQTESNFIVGDSAALFEPRREKLGRAIPGYEVAVLDPDDPTTELGPGEVGEIAVRYGDNPGCFVEYWNKPEKTARKVREGWLLTEDLGTVDEDGYYAFEGRKDDVILSSGYRISPHEIEESLADHAAVAESGVIGVPHDKRGQIPKAFVVLAEGTEPTDALREELQQYVKDNLAKYEYPRALEFIDQLPKTSTGKISRHELRVHEGLE